MKRLVMGVIGVLALGFGAGTASAQDPKIEKGVKVYADLKCAMCHSIAGKGNIKGSLDGVGTKLTVEDIRLWIVDPVAMTAKTKAERKPLMTNKYTALPKEDLDALVAYMVSLKKK